MTPNDIFNIVAVTVLLSVLLLMVFWAVNWGKQR